MRGYACIGLHNPKTPVNVGSVFRAAGCYDAAMIAVSGMRATKYFDRIKTDTGKMVRHKPVLVVDDLRDIIPYGCIPVAIDMVDEARPLMNYIHPERAFYVFGPEDGTLDDNVLSWCRDIVYIPTNRCMNLAATVNVVLYDRMAKQ